MNIRILRPHQTPSFAGVKAASRNFNDPLILPEKTSSIALDLSGSIHKFRTDFLFDYQIFPKTIMHFSAEWISQHRKMMIGDVIIQRALMPPIGFGLCLEFAVRITALIQEDKRVGFAYETLSGHAESGVSEFYFEERSSQIFFTIHTFSEPGHWISRYSKHLFTLPYQRWCTQKALVNVRRNFMDNNTGAYPK